MSKVETGLLCSEPDCGRVFPDESQLMRHLKKRHGKDQQPDMDDKKPEKRNLKEEYYEGIEELTQNVTELVSSLKKKEEDDEAIYARSILEIEMAQNAQDPERFATQNELFAWQKDLTNEFVIERSHLSPENDGVNSLELIEVLNLSNLKLAFFDYSDVFELNKLRLVRILDLSNNKLSSLLGLTYLISIEVLNLDHNCISSLRGIEECITLTKLTCNDNFIEKLSDIKPLKELHTLEFANNKLKNFPEIVLTLEQLPKLKVLSLKGHTFCRLLNYKHDILLRMKLERFDSQKVYDADFEIARAFQKHFLTQNASKKPIEVGEPFVAPQKNTNMARPSTAPGPRPAGLGVHQPKRLPGRLQLLKDDDEDEGNGLAGRKRLRDIEEDNEKVEELKEEINDLKADNEELREEVDQLNDRIKDLETDIRTLELQTKALKAENQTLNAVMQLNKLPTTTADNLTPESAEYYKKKYEMETQLNYRYLDEIKRLQKIIDENGLLGSDDENEQDKRKDDVARRDRVKEKPNRNSSVDSVEWEPYKRPTIATDTKKVDPDIKAKIQSNLQKKVVHVKIRTDEAAPEVIAPQPALPAALAKEQPATSPTSIPIQDRPTSKGIRAASGQNTPLNGPVTITIKRGDKDRLMNSTLSKDASTPNTPGIIAQNPNPAIGPLKEMRRLDSRGSDLDVKEKQSLNSFNGQDKVQIASINKPTGTLAAKRRVNPVLKPIRTPIAPDPNLSKHTFSENNSVISEGDNDPTFEEIENFLRTTNSNFTQLREELKMINSGIDQRPSSAKSQSQKGVEPQSVSTNISVLRIGDSAKQKLSTNNLDSLLVTSTVNTLQKAPSKGSFSIRTAQRSLSKSKK